MVAVFPLYILVLVFLVLVIGFACSYEENGEMPSSSRLLLLPSAGWLAMMPSGKLPRWKVGGAGVVVRSFFPNNGSSGLLCIRRCGGCPCSPVGRGGEGRSRVCVQVVGFGDGVGVLLRECTSSSLRCAGWLTFILLLGRYEAKMKGCSSPKTSIKLVAGFLVLADMVRSLLLLFIEVMVGRWAGIRFRRLVLEGGEEDFLLRSLCCYLSLLPMSTNLDLFGNLNLAVSTCLVILTWQYLLDVTIYALLVLVHPTNSTAIRLVAMHYCKLLGMMVIPPCCSGHAGGG